MGGSLPRDDGGLEKLPLGMPEVSDMKWTESLAVGSKEFTEQVQARITKRRETECLEKDGSWIFRETGSVVRLWNEIGDSK